MCGEISEDETYYFILTVLNTCFLFLFLNVNNYKCVYEKDHFAIIVQFLFGCVQYYSSMWDILVAATKRCMHDSNSLFDICCVHFKLESYGMSHLTMRMFMIAMESMTISWQFRLLEELAYMMALSVGSISNGPCLNKIRQ